MEKHAGRPFLLVVDGFDLRAVGDPSKYVDLYGDPNCGDRGRCKSKYTHSDSAEDEIERVRATAARRQ